MKKYLTYIFLCVSLVSCMHGFDFFYNPVKTLENLKDYTTGESFEYADMIFEKKAYCLYYSEKGRTFLHSQMPSNMDDLEVKGDLTPGKKVYRLSIYNKRLYQNIADIKINCSYTNDGRKWCAISDLQFLQGKKYPNTPICYDLKS